MQQKNGPQQEKNEKVPAAKEGVPPSQTIANAHASGDGALERDKDTILNEKDDKEPTSGATGSEAY